MKKIFKITTFMFLIFMLCENVYAQTFECAYLGSDAQFDYQLAKIVKYVILIIQVAVPVALIIMGVVDMLKAVTAQKEDEIKKGQSTFIKRIISAVILFFVIAIVKFVISVAATDDGTGIMNCVNCFTEGPESSSCG